MELEKSVFIAAPRQRVFDALNDVQVLEAAIPGCEQLSVDGEGRFEAVVGARVGPLKARFKGHATISDLVEPESYVLTGEGKGGPAGHARITARVKLDADGEQTLLHYHVEANIGGKLRQLGGQVVRATAEKLAAEFFDNFVDIVAPAGAAEPAATVSASPGAATGTRGLLVAAGIAAAALLLWWLL